MSERERALDACERIKVSIEDTEGLLLAVEGARVQLSSVADDLGSHIKILKERFNTLVRDLEMVRKKIGSKTWPGDSR